MRKEEKNAVESVSCAVVLERGDTIASGAEINESLQVATLHTEGSSCRGCRCVVVVEQTVSVREVAEFSIIERYERNIWDEKGKPM